LKRHYAKDTFLYTVTMTRMEIQQIVFVNEKFDKIVGHFEMML